MRRVVKLLPGLLTMLLLGVCGAAYAAHDEIPRISIADLKTLIDGKADIVVLDCQGKSAYAKGHIPGAVSLPWVASLNPEDVERLPAGKPIVTYCDCGPGEADSADVASQLIGMGITDVKVLADPAIRGWIKAGYPAER
jgi:rhodanese-related sulfurtransferase